MLMRDIFRDVTSRLNVKDFDQEYYYLDGIQAINDAIASLRVQYVNAGRGDILAETHTLTTTTYSQSYPDFVEIQLPKPVIDTPNIELAIIRGITWVTENEIGDSVFPKFTFATSGNTLYQAIVDITNVSQTETFDAHKFRNFKTENNLTYNVGDVIKSTVGNYYRVLEDFNNDSQQDFANSARFQQVYWMKYDISPYTIASFYNAKRLSELNYVPKEFPTFTVIGKVAHVSQSPTKFTLTYVPEWEYVEDLDEEIKLPPDMLAAVKEQAIGALQNKIGVINEQR